MHYTSGVTIGGAIYIEGKDCTLNNTVFIGNVAHNDGGAIEWNGDNGRVYNLTAIGNYADSDEGYLYGNASEGSSKGGTLVLSGNNMVLEKLNITNSRVFASHYNGDKPLQGGAVFLTGNNCNISDSTIVLSITIRASLMVEQCISLVTMLT